MKQLVTFLLTTLIAFFVISKTVAQTTNNTLIAYYSYTGNVKAIVDELSTLLTADIVEIEPAEEGLKYEADNYAIGSKLIAAIRNNPSDSTSYPDIKPINIDFEKYTNIIIATPLWWSNMAAPMQTFLFEKGNLMEKKNICLIVSSASSNISNVEADAKRLVADGKFNAESLWINNNNRSNMPTLLKEWFDNQNLTIESGNSENSEKIEKNMEEKLYIMVNGKTLTATLVDNSSTQALVAELKKSAITYEAHNYGNFEKVGALGKTFPTNDEEITTGPCDLILYQGNNLCIYYDVNTWNFTRIGKIDNTTQAELKEILGTENCTITISLSNISTGINERRTNKKANQQLYDLQGRKLNSVPQGQIYIEGGEKRITLK